MLPGQVDEEFPSDDDRFQSHAEEIEEQRRVERHVERLSKIKAVRERQVEVCLFYVFYIFYFYNE